MSAWPASLWGRALSARPRRVCAQLAAERRDEMLRDVQAEAEAAARRVTVEERREHLAGHAAPRVAHLAGEQHRISPDLRLATGGGGRDGRHRRALAARVTAGGAPRARVPGPLVAPATSTGDGAAAAAAAARVAAAFVRADLLQLAHGQRDGAFGGEARRILQKVDEDLEQHRAVGDEGGR